MKVYINQYEEYPVYSVQVADGSYPGVDAPDDLVHRFDKIFEQWNQMQTELEELSRRWGR